MTGSDVLPIGTNVRVHSELEETGVCQVIDMRLDKQRGELLYILGHITPRRGILRRWPKKTKLHHWANRNQLEVIQAPDHA